MDDPAPSPGGGAKLRSIGLRRCGRTPLPRRRSSSASCTSMLFMVVPLATRGDTRRFADRAAYDWAGREWSILRQICFARSAGIAAGAIVVFMLTLDYRADPPWRQNSLWFTETIYRNSSPASTGSRAPRSASCCWRAFDPIVWFGLKPPGSVSPTCCRSVCGTARAARAMPLPPMWRRSSRFLFIPCRSPSSRFVRVQRRRLSAPHGGVSHRLVRRRCGPRSRGLFAGSRAAVLDLDERAVAGWVTVRRWGRHGKRISARARDLSRQGGGLACNARTARHSRVILGISILAFAEEPPRPSPTICRARARLPASRIAVGRRGPVLVHRRHRDVDDLPSQTFRSYAGRGGAPI